MLKQLSLVLLLSPLLVACGGGGGVDKIVIPPKSSSSSSVSSSSSTPASSSSSTSTSTSTSTSSSSSSSGPDITVDMTKDWRANSGGEISYITEGVQLSVSAKDEGAVFDLKTPNQVLIQGATIEFVVNASNEFKVSGAGLQVFSQIKGGTYPGDYHCILENADITDGEDQTITCVVDGGVDDIFAQTALDVQVGVQAYFADTGTATGTVVIKSVTVDGITVPTPPEPKLSYDFEEDEAGVTTYPGAAWDPANITATVISIPVDAPELMTGNDSLNALYVLVGNYNAGPLFTITLPEGKTLADYNVKVDTYLAHKTAGGLGTDSGGNNFYKDLLVLAGTTISSSINPDNPAYQGKIATEGNVDAWHTFDLPIDAAKGGLLTGTFQLAFGVNRPGGADGYYIDNLRLELK